MSGRGLKDEGVSFLIGGEAGQGINRSGALLGKAAMRGGFHIFGNIDYPSVIRGGHNFYVLRASKEQVHSHTNTIDLVLALNKETATLHESELHKGGGIIVDEQIEFESGELERDDISIYPVPLAKMVDEIKGRPVIKNTVALGSALALVGFGTEIVKGVIADAFPGRESIIRMNQEAIEKGYEYTRKQYEDTFHCRMEPSEDNRSRMMLTGNEAVGLGAIQAGCRFYSAYPMTPATSLLHFLAERDEENGMFVIQPESELSAMNMVIGASYSGLRAMTATSGGGFCLMTEALGLAAMTETPVVVMVAQRPGPSTGLPTYGAQGDLLFTINASQSEFPRVVMAPGDVEECFYLTTEAFNLADRFQIPVIIVTDKHVAESHKSTELFELEKVKRDRGKLVITDEWTGKEEYKRYLFTEDGVSPRLLPGTKGATVFANSNEHDENGYTAWQSEPAKSMMDKRWRKMDHIKEAVSELEPIRAYGDPDPKVTLFGWGSTKGPALEALKLLNEEGVEARLIQIVFLEPFPGKKIEKYLKGNDKHILFENNRTAQLGKIIRQHNFYDFTHVYLRYDGRAFDPREIRDHVMEVL
jgi:2-oxoglutarate ferredoxin oxidoreductase subunit alpha